MSSRMKRGCLFGGVGLAALVIIGGVVVYVLLGRVANFSGASGAGNVAMVEVPAGFQVTLFAEGLNNPRFMAVGPDGHLYVADRRNDRIVVLPDENGDGLADETLVFAEGVEEVHSLIYHEGAWYVGVPSGVIRLVDGDGDGVADERTVIIDDYPTSGSHTTRTVAFLPDGRMVVSVGSSCNVCEEEDARRATVLVYDDGTGAGERIFASGLRNAVGLAIDPNTGELWATNNGRDLLGDDLPPEALYLVGDGLDYGWPVCHNGDMVDPDMGFVGACEGVEFPVVNMQAHSAPLGLTFYGGDMFPAGYSGDIFIAFHGSWNRSEPTGYKIVRVDMVEGVPAGEVTDFATGWLLADGSADGRPTGVTVGSDGALYVSDDKGGYIYRISYSE